MEQAEKFIIDNLKQSIEKSSKNVGMKKPPNRFTREIARAWKCKYRI
ncbi:MAG: hypothetical protein V8R30_06235 [Clostridia bacterium]